MKYSFYQYFNEDGNVFRLYTQTHQDGVVRCYEFKTDIKGISNEPGITRLFGKEIFDSAGNYFLFPLDFSNVEVGEFILLQEEELFTKLNFILEDKLIQGSWLLRRLSTGEILFWKPFPVILTTQDRTVTVQITPDAPGVVMEQQFSAFGVTSEGNEWNGIIAAEGVWTGKDYHTTLFSGEIIESIYQQLSESLEGQLVDYNHDLLNDGSITKVTLLEKNGMKYIEGSGTGNKPIPPGSGLSLFTQSTIKWDNKLNVYALLEAAPLGVSIITESNPACTICMIR